MDRKLAVDAYAAARPIDSPFLLLTGVFLAALVACNLIARTFVTVDLGFHEFVVSAGILPYPVTFLVTDFLSEIYGRRRATKVVTAGLFASAAVFGVLWLGQQFPATAASPGADAAVSVLPTNATRTVLGAMVACLLAQYVDVWGFHFWRWLTNGRHLWLRCSASTIVAQFVESVLVVLVLFHGEPDWPQERIVATVRDLWVFKTLMALAGTPFCYAGVWLLQRWRPRPL